jgi:uncharacterized protein YndB with AHSA1/START domain
MAEMGASEAVGAGIAPIVQTVEVKAPPAQAFEIFTGQMGRWWPQGRTIAGTPHVAIVIEPREDGRWYERDAEGNECQWGKVLAWEPPSRLLLGWQINTQWAYDAEFLTELELTFTPTPRGGTLVRLEHRDLERFGADVARHAESLRGGWPRYLRDFAGYADANA